MLNKDNIDRLGGIIKTARLKQRMTCKQLAERLNISLRHLSAIENENQKPSYELLFSIIRELVIPADTIFYPELGYKRSEIGKLKLMLEQCGEKEISVVTATLQSLLDNENNKIW